MDEEATHVASDEADASLNRKIDSVQLSPNSVVSQFEISVASAIKWAKL